MVLTRSILPAAVAGMAALGGDYHGIPIRVDAGRMLMKSLPAIEGGERVIYMQASTQTRDYQGERILAKALIQSIPYFLLHGKIDLDHGSRNGEILGQRIDPYAAEIGRPIEARPDGDLVMVKASIFQAAKDASSEAKLWAESADLFWGSLQVRPPVLWYPSVQGLVTNEAGVVSENLPTQEVRGVLWQSIGLSRTPVSRDIPGITTVPLRVFAKAFGASAGLAGVLSELKGYVQPVPALDAPGELRLSTVQTVLEGLADDGRSFAAPSEFLQAMESRGVAQTETLAVLLALVGA